MKLSHLNEDTGYKPVKPGAIFPYHGHRYTVMDSAIVQRTNKTDETVCLCLMRRLESRGELHLLCFFKVEQGFGGRAIADLSRIYTTNIRSDHVFRNDGGHTKEGVKQAFQKAVEDGFCNLSVIANLGADE